MRRRRAERLIVRAGADIEARSIEGARAMLEEARALWPGAPGLRTLEDRIANGHVLSVPEIHPSRWKEAAAAVAIVVFAGGTVAMVLTKGGVLLPKGENVLPWRYARAVVPSARDAGPGVLPARDAGADLLRARDARAIVEPAVIVARAPVTLSDEAQSVEPEPVESGEPTQSAASTQSTGSTRSAESTRSAAPTQLSGLGQPSASAQPAAPIESTSPPPRVAAPKAEAPRPNPSVAPPDERVSRLPAETTTPSVTRPDVAPVAAIPSSPPPAPAPLSSPPVTAPAAAETEAVPPQEPPVRSVLARYAAAYSDLDVDAVKRVWPSVNRAALARAFENLDSQRVSLGDCRIQVDGGAANARCTGSATWTPKIGGGKRTDRRTWDFDLEKSAAGWQIVSARVQNK